MIKTTLVPAALAFSIFAFSCGGVDRRSTPSGGGGGTADNGGSSGKGGSGGKGGSSGKGGASATGGAAGAIGAGGTATGGSGAGGAAAAGGAGGMTAGAGGAAGSGGKGGATGMGGAVGAGGGAGGAVGAGGAGGAACTPTIGVELKAAGVTAASCVFMLPNVVYDPMHVSVHLGATEVDFDGANGFQFSSNYTAITVFGAWCDMIKAGTGMALTCNLGCP